MYQKLSYNTIQLYIQSNYSIKSTTDFKQFLRSTSLTHKCIMASVDAENIFTNVHVQKTIKIVIENVYNHLFILTVP